MLTIIIIEDEFEMAQLHTHFIQTLPHVHISAIATTLAQARVMLKQLQPDLILLDNYLPDGKGIDFLRSLQNEAHIPACILVTAANDHDTVLSAYHLGVFDYLVKPIDYQRLQASILKYRQQQTLLQEQTHLQQHHIDHLFFKPAPFEDTSTENKMTLPKNIDPFTYEQILAIFIHANIEHSAESLAECIGISKSTARRYLDQAVKMKQLVAFLAYGKVGRPERMYRNPNVIEKDI